jgi:hypothetical protein
VHADIKELITITLAMTDCSPPSTQAETISRTNKISTDTLANIQRHMLVSIHNILYTA